MTAPLDGTVPVVPSRWRARPAILARLVVGLWIFGTGEALLVDARLGNAPWTVLAEGVSLTTPLTVGMATALIGVLVLCGWIPLRVRPGLGTIANVVVIGLAIDVMLPLIPSPEGLALRWVTTLGGIALVGVGSGLYLSTALGPGPRDGWMTGIHRRTGVPISGVRAGIELSALLGGWALGGTVGLGTIAFAVLVGPAVGTALRVLGVPRRMAGAPRA